MALSSQQIRPILRISIDAALGLSYDIYTTEQRLVSKSNQSSMTNRRSFVTAGVVHILSGRVLDGLHTRGSRGSSMPDCAEQSQSVNLPFGNRRRLCETKPIPCARQGRDGLTTNEAAVQNKAKPGRDRTSGGKANVTCGAGPTGEGIVRNKANLLGDRPETRGTAWATARNKANFRGRGSPQHNLGRARTLALPRGTKPIGGAAQPEVEEPGCETKPTPGLAERGWRGRRAKQSQFLEVGRWRRGSCCAEQSQFAGTPDE